MEAERPAFYALAPGGWRDLVTILHPPYTLWHLSYVAIGAAAAPQVHWSRLAWTLLAFFCAVGVGAHALDELKGRPLGTRLSDRALRAIGVLGLLAALAIGCAGAVVVSPTLIPLVLLGGFLVPAYNLELFGGSLPHRLVVRRGLGRVPGPDRLVGQLPGIPLRGGGHSRASPRYSAASGSASPRGGSRRRSASCAGGPPRSRAASNSPTAPRAPSTSSSWPPRWMARFVPSPSRFRCWRSACWWFAPS